LPPNPEAMVPLLPRPLASLKAASRSPWAPWVIASPPWLVPLSVIEPRPVSDRVG